MSNWITANRPPDSNRAVLVYAGDGFYAVAHYQRGDPNWWRSDATGGTLLGVTHWCGLPLKPGKRGRK